MNRVSLMDIVHKMFQGDYVDICKGEGGYFVSARASAEIPYPDGREIIYTFSIKGAADTGQLLTRLGWKQPDERPLFQKGDKVLLAERVLEILKNQFPNWEEIVDARTSFKEGGPYQ